MIKQIITKYQDDPEIEKLTNAFFYSSETNVDGRDGLFFVTNRVVCIKPKRPIDCDNLVNDPKAIVLYEFEIVKA